MTTFDLNSLPTAAALQQIADAKIAQAQADGTYNYDVCMAIIAERDRVVATERVFYSHTDGTDGFETVYGTASERMIKALRIA